MKAGASRLSGRRGGRLAVVLVLAAAAACSPGYKTVGEAVFPYVDSVQSSNWPLLRCLYAGTEFPGPEGDSSLDAFQSWARGRVVEFEEARGRGEVDLAADGIGLIKGFGLGGGTLLGIARIETKGPSVIEVETPATFRYDEIDPSVLPEGSVVHVAVAPVGRIVPVRAAKEAGETALDALKEIRLRWTLRRPPAREGCSLEWGVASIEVVEGSEKTSRIAWRF